MSLSVENVFNAINKNKKGLEINIVQTNKYIQNIESLQVKKPIKNNEKPISIDSSTHMEDNKHYFKTISGTVSNLPKLMNDLLESSDYYCLGVNKIIELGLIYLGIAIYIYVISGDDIPLKYIIKRKEKYM